MGINNPDRIAAHRYFSTQTWCTVEQQGPIYELYCDAILDHTFNVSPKGNGLDCHRTWETLYLGRYPVMRRLGSLEKLYADLPVVFVDRWEEVTQDFLMRKAEEFAESQFNYDKLRFYWWRDFIKKRVSMGDVIQMSRLGRHGRFGNCLFQSAFLRCYAKQHNLEVQAPMFPGQGIFDFRFAPISCILPGEEERTKPNSSCEAFSPAGVEFVNKDIGGYFQYHTSWYMPHKDDLQRMFTPNTPPAFDAAGRTVVGIHARWGDYDNKKHAWRAPPQWYVDWINSNWDRLDNPVLLIAAEDQRFLKHLDELAKPDTQARLAYDGRLIVTNESPTQDWINLSSCDIILATNSTFSFTAALFSTSVKEAWRASLPDVGFVKFDPWNALPLLPDPCENYESILLPVDSPVDPKQCPVPGLVGPQAPVKSSYEVSVIIPCYNQGIWLKQAITSVHKQTWPALEVIVVNDGSTDNTEEVANDCNVRLITIEHSGPSAARNAGIELARGNYILPLDADDRLHPKFIERTLQHRRRGDIVGTRVQRFGFISDVWKQGTDKPTLQSMLYENSLVVTSLYPKAMWQAIGGYDPKYDAVEDWEFWIRALAHGFKACIIPEVLFYYRHWDRPSVSKNIGLRVQLRDAVRAKYNWVANP